MSDLEIYLYPALAFLILGALAATWQARFPGADIAARNRILARRYEAKTWQKMPQWDAFRALQDDPVRHARAARRRAAFLALGACAVVAILLLAR